MIIDTHHHFWKFTVEDFGWIGDDMAPIRRDFLPPELARVSRASGVDGVISVQARQSEEETLWLLGFAEGFDWIKGVVGWLPIAGKDFEASLPTSKKLVGLRHVVQGEPDGFLAGESFNRGIRVLTRRGMAYDILVLARQLKETIQFVDRHPNQRFILDHLAKPNNHKRELEPWASDMKELAKRGNVYCKVSGGITEADLGWTPESLKPYFDLVLEAFGAPRLMFGSNWPVSEAAGGYQKWLDCVSDWAKRLTPAERDQLFSRTAISAYRLS